MAPLTFLKSERQIDCLGFGRGVFQMGVSLRPSRYLSLATAALIFQGFLLSASAETGLSTAPDLNGDGRSDLLWYNPATGQTMAWLMDGSVTASSSTLLNDPDWKIVATGDFNGDNMTDL